MLFGAASDNGGEELSDLQRRVLAAIVRGEDDAAIANSFKIPINEVESLLHRAYRTLGVDNRIDAIYELARRGAQLV